MKTSSALSNSPFASKARVMFPNDSSIMDTMPETQTALSPQQSPAFNYAISVLAIFTDTSRKPLPHNLHGHFTQTTSTQSSRAVHANHFLTILTGSSRKPLPHNPHGHFTQTTSTQSSRALHTNHFHTILTGTSHKPLPHNPHGHFTQTVSQLRHSVRLTPF